MTQWLTAEATTNDSTAPVVVMRVLKIMTTKDVSSLGETSNHFEIVLTKLMLRNGVNDLTMKIYQEIDFQ